MTLAVRDNYSKIVENNLKKLYKNLPVTLEQDLPAKKTGNFYEFETFGQQCRIGPNGITLGSEKQSGVLGILISLYALNANPTSLIIEPLKAFKDFPDSMPYAGAFTTHTQDILVPHVAKIKNCQKKIISNFRGCNALSIAGGDFSFLLNPLPKISLCYIFYESDEDFPASVICLYSNNALSFLPIDALADVGEYTSKQILRLLE